VEVDFPHNQFVSFFFTHKQFITDLTKVKFFSVKTFGSYEFCGYTCIIKRIKNAKRIILSICEGFLMKFIVFRATFLRF
jgi:hypothetical protein